MQFRADQYFQAGVERMRQARDLYEQGARWALTMYCAGLAVECMLRAFRWKEDASFEGRHAMEDLLKASRLMNIDDEYMRRRGAHDEEITASGQKLRASLNEITALWHNNLRYASEASTLAFLKSVRRDRGVRGDPLKKNARDLLEAAQTIIDRGITLWNSKTN